MLLAAAPARALAHGGNFQGVVLGIQASNAQIIIRQEAGAGRPGSIYSVKVTPVSDINAVHLGDHVGGDLDNGHTPPGISHLEVLPVASSALLQTIRRAPLLHEGDRMPQTPFVDQDGRRFTFSQFIGHEVVLAFIYTRCKDARMCPLITAKFAQLQTAFAKRAGDGTRLVEITLDPQYDNPLILKNYGGVFNADPSRWTFGTGKPDDVLNFDAQFGLLPFADPRFGLIHTERTVVIDKRGVIRTLIDDPSWSTGEILAQINLLQNRSSNLLARLDLTLSSAAIAVCGDRVAGFSGLTDLFVVIAIFGACGWGLFRLARGIAAGKA